MTRQHTSDGDTGKTKRKKRNISVSIAPDGYLNQNLEASDRPISDLLREGLYRVFNDDDADDDSDASPEIDDPAAEQRFIELEAHVEALSRKIDTRTTREHDDDE